MKRPLKESNVKASLLTPKVSRRLSTVSIEINTERKRQKISREQVTSNLFQYMPANHLIQQSLERHQLIKDKERPDIDFLKRSDFKNSSNVFLPVQPTKLGFMSSCLYVKKPEDIWSPSEIHGFESAIMLYGKDFRAISRVLGTKSRQEVTDYFYVWKKTCRYEEWKRICYSD